MITSAFLLVLSSIYSTLIITKKRKADALVSTTAPSIISSNSQIVENGIKEERDILDYSKVNKESGIVRRKTKKTNINKVDDSSSQSTIPSQPLSDFPLKTVDHYSQDSSVNSSSDNLVSHTETIPKDSTLGVHSDQSFLQKEKEQQRVHGQFISYKTCIGSLSSSR